MTLPPYSRFPLAADLSICRILNGMWQVSGAHGAIDPARAVEAMFAYHDAGFTTWDLADHYGPAEDFHRRLPPGIRGAIRRRPPRRNSGLYEMGPLPRPDDKARRRGSGRGLALPHGHGASRSAAIPLVGLRRPALSRRAAPPRRSARGRPHPPSRPDQFRHRAAPRSSPNTASRSSRTRCSIRSSIAVPTGAWRRGAASTASLC